MMHTQSCESLALREKKRELKDAFEERARRIIEKELKDF